MNAKRNFGAITFNKVFLLPVVLTVSFSFIFIGIRAPTLSKLQKTKMHNRAFAETQTKVAKAALTKAENELYVAETCRHIDLTVRPDSVLTHLFSNAVSTTLAVN